jgi:hypothetical protein
VNSAPHLAQVHNYVFLLIISKSTHSAKFSICCESNLRTVLGVRKARASPRARGRAGRSCYRASTDQLDLARAAVTRHWARCDPIAWLWYRSLVLTQPRQSSYTYTLHLRVDRTLATKAVSALWAPRILAIHIETKLQRGVGAPKSHGGHLMCRGRTRFSHHWHLFSLSWRSPWLRQHQSLDGRNQSPPSLLRHGRT